MHVDLQAVQDGGVPSDSFYLGPRSPRLVASTWQQVEIAAAAGVLDETHWVELKEAVPASSKPANLELARDLASLSVDGGLLLIGVADAKGAAGKVVGTDIAGLETRIAQVASGRISPALPVTIDVIRMDGRVHIGLVLVSVPASEGAPHMVDGHYWGRDDHGKRVLSDDEIRRLFTARQKRASGFQERLSATPSRLDPLDLTSLGRLYVRLEPVAPFTAPLTESLDAQHPIQLIQSALDFQPQWSPSFPSLTYSLPHQDGLAAVSVPVENAADHGGQFFLLLLLADDGVIHVSAPAVLQYGAAAGDPYVISPGLILEVLHSTVAVAGRIAAEHAGYWGSWRTGVLITHLRGLLPSQAHSSRGLQRFHPYASQQYVGQGQATTQAMVDNPATVVKGLAKNLLRGLGVERRFMSYEHPADIYRKNQ